MNKFYKCMKIIFGWFFRRLYRIKVINPGNEIVDKPYIVCGNHTAMMDVSIISCAFKTQVYYMAKKEVFKIPLIGRFLKAMGAFPVDRKAGDVAAFKQSIKLLENGQSIGIFPQGTRCPYVHPKDTEIKSGIGMIASRAKVGILPICIRTKKNKLCIFRKTEIIIGNYLSPEELAFPEIGGREKYDKITEYAFSKVIDLYENTEGKTKPKLTYEELKAKQAKDAELLEQKKESKK